MWYLKLELIAGRGGDGIISWSRNRYNSRMGPAGGDGGQGGSILLKVNPKFSDFSHIKGQSLKAQNGSNGRKSGKNGSSGADLFLEVPLETEIYDLNNNMRKAILSEMQSSHLLCKGGRGGRGNQSFKNAQFQSPWLYELGEKGEQLNVLLKLSSSSLIGIVNLSGFDYSEILDNSLLVKNNIEFFEFPEVIFSKSENMKKMYSEHLLFCKFFLFLINQESEDWIQKVNLIKEFLKEKGFKDFFVLFFHSKTNTEIEKEKLSSIGKTLYLQESNINNKEITQEIIEFSSSLKDALPLIKPSSGDSEYVEYSDELFPEKEELKIEKVEGGWEVNSRRLSYWSERIPQTTTHNIERLKVKLKVEDIMKKIKQSGGEKGEKLRIGGFETEIY